MNKHIETLVCLAAVVFAVMLAGCSDDSDEQSAARQFGSVCTTWGLSPSEVEERMGDYELYSADSDCLYYKSKDGERKISYQFNLGTLVASTILIPEEGTSLQSLQSSFSKYEYLGEKSSMEVYVNKTANTLATIGKKSNKGVSYYAVGYTMLDEN